VYADGVHVDEGPACVMLGPTGAVLRPAVAVYGPALEEFGVDILSGLSNGVGEQKVECHFKLSSKFSIALPIACGRGYSSSATEYVDVLGFLSRRYTLSLYYLILNYSFFYNFVFVLKEITFMSVDSMLLLPS
jgi:hypothetical protein